MAGSRAPSSPGVRVTHRSRPSPRPIPGKGDSHSRTRRWTAGRGPVRSALSSPTGTASTTWPATCGSGRRTGTPTFRTRPGRHAVLPVALRRRRAPMTRPSLNPAFPARSSRVGPTCAPSSTASATDRRRGSRRCSTPAPATSASAVSRETRSFDHHQVVHPETF